MLVRTLLRVVAFASAVVDVVLLGGSVPEPETQREPSFGELQIVNGPTTKTESLERTLDRAESILGKQLTILADTHGRAVRTVRVEVVLVGAIASVAQITPDRVPMNGWLEAGGVLLIGSIAVGIFTSGSSSPDFGPGPNYVRSNLDAGDPNTDVYLRLLQGYSEAISYNNDVVSNSATYLFVAQGLLIGSVTLGSIGVFVGL